jgi:hypothetical protein
MVENTSLKNSKTSATEKEFEENSYRLITHNKWGHGEKEQNDRGCNTSDVA